MEFWKAEEGWGELILPDGRKCFGHFSAIDQSHGFRSLHAGDFVQIVARQASQDDYNCVADVILPT